MSRSIPLSEIAQVNPPRPPISLDADDEVSFVPMSDVSASGRWEKRQVRRFSEVSSGYTYFAENDVLFAKITPCTENGKGCHAVGVRNGIGFASTEFHVLRANGTGDAGFVYQWSMYAPLRLKAAAVMSGSAGQQRVPASFFDSFEIPRIDKTEQSKIAEILSTVDRAIEQTEGLIAKQQRIKTGLMQDLLTRGIDEQGNLRSKETHQFKDSPLGRIPVEWDVKRIADVGQIVRGSSPRPKGDPRYYGGDVPRLMVEDVTRDGKFVTPRVDFLTAQGAKLSRPMRAETLTLVCSGTVGVPSFLAVDACIHDGFLGFRRISDECEPEFLYYTFIFELDKLDTSATHGGVFTNLTTDIVKNYLVAFPPFAEQQRIVELLNATDAALTKSSTDLDKLRFIKTALMQDLLTGEKRVTPLLEPAVTT